MNCIYKIFLSDSFLKYDATDIRHWKQLPETETQRDAFRIRQISIRKGRCCLNFSEMVRQVGQRHSDSKTCCKVKGEGHLEGGFVNLGKEGGEKKQWKEHWGISAMCAKGTLGRDVVN